MANILLDDLDREVEYRGHRFVRYADDITRLKKSRRSGDRVMASAQRFLEWKLKLKHQGLLSVKELRVNIHYLATWLRLDRLCETTPRADPHAGHCGGWGRKAFGYMIS